ncbi:MAG: type II toxin-antitoxin system VapC family toxin [Beijerinckiaceae bacterium]
MLCDASVLVPLFVREPSSDAVAATLANWRGVPCNSDFAVGEFASAVSIRMRRKDLTANQAQETLLDFDMWISRKVRRITLQTSDVAQAAQIVRRFELALRLPDALHIAMAQRLGEPIATRDKRQAAAAMALGLLVVEPAPSKGQ